MGYVDLQRRREERARGCRDGTPNPYLFSTLGFALATPASWMSFSLLWFGSPPPLVLAPMIPSAVLLALAVRQLGRQRTSATRADGEKQLLAAIRDSDDGITPVEAALVTPLTVDEAEKILSRLADRGHLLVESRDGALSYTLPGRRQESAYRES
jgi:hypothetical protein